MGLYTEHTDFISVLPAFLQKHLKKQKYVLPWRDIYETYEFFLVFLPGFLKNHQK